MGITLSDEERRLLTLFEDETDATVRDCVIHDEYDQILFLIAAGDMPAAIGPDGRTVSAVEERLGRDVKLIEDADRPGDFVANALAPAAVYNVTISENNDRVAYVEVADADRGAAIGSDGRNIEAARLLADRHFDMDAIELT
jgi:N utilization substance protein A